MIVDLDYETAKRWRRADLRLWHDAQRTEDGAECPRCGYLVALADLPQLHECTGQTAPPKIREQRADECRKARRLFAMSRQIGGW